MIDPLIDNLNPMPKNPVDAVRAQPQPQPSSRWCDDILNDLDLEAMDTDPYIGSPIVPFPESENPPEADDEGSEDSSDSDIPPHAEAETAGSKGIVLNARVSPADVRLFQSISRSVFPEPHEHVPRTQQSLIQRRVRRVGRKVSHVRLHRAILSKYAASRSTTNRRPRSLVPVIPRWDDISADSAVIKGFGGTSANPRRFLATMQQEQRDRKSEKVRQRQAARQVHRAARHLVRKGVRDRSG